MEISDLKMQLQKDAELEVPPFGSDAIRIALELGSNATELLVQEISSKGRTSFLALEALRECNFKAYNLIPVGERAEIYANALKKSRFFNAWGLPSHQLTSTSNALISLGDKAIMQLKPLLRDRRDAPLEGSQDATTSAIYRNRVCDYAMLFISKIKGTRYTYFEDPVERDKTIETLWREG